MYMYVCIYNMFVCYSYMYLYRWIVADSIIESGKTTIINITSSTTTTGGGGSAKPSKSSSTTTALHAPLLTSYSPKSVAFLQYTSGSTSEPKGVMITHENLNHNEMLIQHAILTDTSTVNVSWLPQYHDMGLIGSI